MQSLIRTILLAVAASAALLAQPVVNGALNTASYITPGFPNAGLAQGSMVALFGRNIGPASIVQATSFPLPTQLGGTSARITAGGQTRDLILTYSLSTQVGAIIPSSTPTGTAQITVTYNGQTSAPLTVQVVASQFGIFTINQAGSGPAVVQNFVSQTDQPVNTVLVSARPGQAMTLWGTGLGAITGSDAGAPPVGNLAASVEVLVGGRPANILYKGRSGCCAGVDQIVFEVPAGLNGCYVPLVVKVGNQVSNYTSLAISPNGGRCSDPLSYSSEELARLEATGSLRVGSVNMAKATIKTTVPIFGTLETTSEVGSGVFRAFDANQLVASRGQGGTSVSIGACTVFSYAGEGGSPVDPVQARVLDAGARIDVTGPGGTKQIAKGGTGDYTSVFSNIVGGIPGVPGGGGTPFIVAGGYTATNGGGGADVGGFTTNLTVPGNFSWTNEASITAVSRGSNLNITWTGAPASAYVYMTGGSYDATFKVGAAFYCMERGSAGQFTIPSAVLLALPASAVIEGTPMGQLMVGFTSDPTRFNATGLDVGIFSYSIVTGKNLSYQ